MNMDFKIGLWVLTLLVGCFAHLRTEPDLSIFFDHVDADASIVGGTQAAAGSHPHMVALTVGLVTRSFFCGGSLVSQRSILTAAHCVTAVFSGGSLPNNLRATVGTNRWNSGGQKYNLARNVTHPDFVEAEIKNDVSILVTDANVILSNNVQPVPITYAFIGQGVSAKVAGWGRIRGGGSFSATLLELTLSTIDSNACVGLVAQASIDFNIRAPAIEPQIQICTLHSPGHGTCQGDSGSALRRADNGQQFGIVSWGFPCALGAPDMFVRLSAYQSWLTENIV